MSVGKDNYKNAYNEMSYQDLHIECNICKKTKLHKNPQQKYLDLLENCRKQLCCRFRSVNSPIEKRNNKTVTFKLNKSNMRNPTRLSTR